MNSEEEDTRVYENPPEEARDYDRDRDRSRSPVADDRDHDRHRDDRDREDRARSASPNGRDPYDSRGPPPGLRLPEEEEEDANTAGTNLFVTGIHPSMTEQFLADIFNKHGKVEKCNIMRDPHSRESRGFGFVNMATPEDADAAKQGLAGAVIEGRTMSIEKARRKRPRTPTPGHYLGPPKREDFRGPPRGRYRDRYDDYRGYRGREDYGSYRSSRTYDDRAYGRRDAYGPRHIDRYASSSRDYGNESRRGGGYSGREPRSSGYASREGYTSGPRSYESRGPEPRADHRAEPRDDRYSRR